MNKTSLFTKTMCITHFVQSRADVGADDKLDAFDLGLDEHDAEMLVLGGVGICTEELHVVGLELVFSTCRYQKGALAIVGRYDLAL